MAQAIPRLEGNVELRRLLCEFRLWLTGNAGVPQSATVPYTMTDPVDGCQFTFDPIGDAFLLAEETVLPAIKIQRHLYKIALFNLAMSFLIQFGSDNPNTQPPNFWQGLRNKYGYGQSAVGVIQSASDNGTSASIVVPDYYKDASIMTLQNLQNPWGKTYELLAQQYKGVWSLNRGF